MRTAQCRLCLADIPHDYDHSLEVELEKGDLEELDEVTFDFITPNNRPAHSSDRWPDAFATTALIFVLLICNLMMLLVFLVIWSLYRESMSSTSCCQGSILLAADYACAGGNVVMNLSGAIVARKKLKSRVISFAMGVAAAFWCGVLIWTRLNSLESM
jgi:hypothetical protein